MTGLDTNLLVALAVESHPKHSAARSILSVELTSGTDLALVQGVAAEFAAPASFTPRTAEVRSSVRSDLPVEPNPQTFPSSVRSGIFRL
jgi:predicted nucleic acid-binding protein